MGGGVAILRDRRDPPTWNSCVSRENCERFPLQLPRPHELVQRAMGIIGLEVMAWRHGDVGHVHCAFAASWLWEIFIELYIALNTETPITTMNTIYISKSILYELFFIVEFYDLYR